MSVTEGCQQMPSPDPACCISVTEPIGAALVRLALRRFVK
jgi:hypothetical protein